MPKKRKVLQQQQRGKRKPGQPRLRDKAPKLKADAGNGNGNGKGKGNGNGKTEAKPGPKNPSQLQPTIPFSPEDTILLVGEGDLSFSRALVEHHHCGNVTATVLEPSLEELVAKYPHAKENVEKLEAEGSKVTYGVDAKKMGPFAVKSGKESVGSMDRISMPYPLREWQQPQHWQRPYPYVADRVPPTQYSTSLTSGARARM